MAAGVIRAGKAVVEASFDDSKIGADLRRAEARFKKFGAEVTTIGLKLGAFGAVGFAAFLPIIKAASDATETFSKFSVVFKSARDDMRAWVNETANAMGRSQKDIADNAATLKSFLSAFEDIDPSKANEMAKTIAKLAVDFGSFYNLPDEEAFTKLISGLSGEIEPLRRLGIIINESTVAAQLALNGIDYQKATEAQKVMGRFAVIMKTSTLAQGDAVRTADQFANVLKRLQSKTMDAAAALGAAMQPALTKVLKLAVSGIETLGDFTKENQGLAAALGVTAVSVTASIVAISAGLVVLGQLFELYAIGSKAVRLFAASNLVAAATSGQLGIVLKAVLIPQLATLGVALVAVGAGIAVLYLMAKAGEYVGTFSDAAGKASEKLDEANETTGRYLSTLELYSKKTRLTTSEQEDAAEAIARLSDRYGDLGIKVNAAAGSLDGYEAASAKVMAMMRAEKLRGIETEIREKKYNISEASKSLDSLTSQGEFAPAVRGLQSKSVIRLLAGGGEEKVKEYGKQIDAENKEIRRLELEAAKLRGGANPLADAQATQATQLKKREAITAGREAIADLDKQQEEERRRLLSEEEQQLAAVNDRLKEQLALLEKGRDAGMLDGNVLTPLDADRRQGVIEANAEAQRQKIRSDTAADYARKLKTLESSLSTTAFGDLSRELDNVNEKLEEQLATLDDLVARSQRLGEAGAVARFEDLKTRLVTDAERNRARIREKYAKEERERMQEIADRQTDQREFWTDQGARLADAQGNSVLAKRMRDALRDIQRERQLQQLFGDDEKSKAAARQIEKAIDSYAARSNFSRGVFQANQADSLRGGGESIQQRIAKSTEETAKNTKKIANTKPQAPRFT